MRGLTDTAMLLLTQTARCPLGKVFTISNNLHPQGLINFLTSHCPPLSLFRAHRLATQAAALTMSVTDIHGDQEAEAVTEEVSADVAELLALRATATGRQADWLDDAAREAGAYPKGW